MSLRPEAGAKGLELYVRAKHAGGSLFGRYSHGSILLHVAHFYDRLSAAVNARRRSSLPESTTAALEQRGRLWLIVHENHVTFHSSILDEVPLRVILPDVQLAIAQAHKLVRRFVDRRRLFIKNKCTKQDVAAAAPDGRADNEQRRRRIGCVTWIRGSGPGSLDQSAARECSFRTFFVGIFVLTP